MSKNRIGMFFAPVLLLSLVACTNHANDAMDRTKHNGPLNVSYNGNDRGIDHNGPLTEDYSTNRNRGNGFRISRINDRNYGYDMKKTPLNVSSMYTSMSSNAYPHTRAILIQNAQYQFIPVYPGQGNGYQMWFQQQPQMQMPNYQAPTPQWKAPTQQRQTPTTQQKAPTKYSAPTTQGISQFAQQVINLTNVQRKQNGLPALKVDTKLSGVAQKKAVEMQQKHYFSHTSPTYGSPFDMMRDFGVTYSSAGENIAMGQRTPQEVVTSWMNSPGHRQNILSRNFTHIGVGVEQSGYHWSQMFIGK